MKTFCVAVLCALAAAGASAFQATDPLPAIVRSYLDVHAQLAADKIDGVTAASAAIVAEAEKLGQERGGRIAGAASTLARVADLKAAREAFGPLSDAVIAAVQASGKDPGGARLAFCPMVKKSWLQKDAKIRNPYYGSAMLECGEFKELKK
jgi:hypothetical protein